MGRKASLRIDKFIKNKNIGARELAEKSGIAYNTALMYQRDAGDRVSKDVLEKIAETLDVEVYELFLGDQDADEIIEIAKKVGIDVSGKSYSDLLSEIRSRVS